MYAHVLSEYSDDELAALVRVAMAASSPRSGDSFLPKLLRGRTWDSTKEWITVGFPSIAQEEGRYYFEIKLEKDVAAPQVWLASGDFEIKPRTASCEGVGDDVHSWAVDGVNVGRWHAGQLLPWGQ